MGSGISGNYENVIVMMNVGFWKVHLATRKESKEEVTLWQLDKEKVRSFNPTRKERKKFYEICQHSIKTMKTISHPNFLRIIEADESAMAFSAERFTTSLEADLANLTSDEVYYLTEQMITALQFLHMDVKLASLDLEPSSFVITYDLKLKICGLPHASVIFGEDGQVIPRIPWSNSPLWPPLAFSAPEYLLGKPTTARADVFAFGVLVCTMFHKSNFITATSPEEVSQKLSKGSIQVENVPDDLQPMLQCCIECDPKMRLTFDEIKNFPAFSSVAIRALKYVDMIMLKDETDRFAFYKGFYTQIDVFSPRLLKQKFLPLCIKEIQTDARFGLSCLPIVFRIGQNLGKIEFMELVMKPLGSSLVKMSPPSYASAVLEGLPLMIEKIDRSHVFDSVYPIICAALDTRVVEIQLPAFESLPLLITQITDSLIANKVLPKLNQMIGMIDDIRVVEACIKAYGPVVLRTDHEMFGENVVPIFVKAWKRLGDPTIPEMLLRVLLLLQPSDGSILRYVIPCCCELLTNEKVEPEVQAALCVFIDKALANMKKAREITKVTPKAITPYTKPKAPAPKGETEGEPAKPREPASVPEPVQPPTTSSAVDLSQQQRRPPPPPPTAADHQPNPMFDMTFSPPPAQRPMQQIAPPKSDSSMDTDVFGLFAGLGMGPSQQKSQQNTLGDSFL